MKGSIFGKYFLLFAVNEGFTKTLV